MVVQAVGSEVCQLIIVQQMYNKCTQTINVDADGLVHMKELFSYLSYYYRTPNVEHLVKLKLFEIQLKKLHQQKQLRIGMQLSLYAELRRADELTCRLQFIAHPFSIYSILTRH
ncbi:hypothetical protein M5689_013771 [Euphorbia peplus]|nr:hypothetical protein M5689_013771 [Euphorbia peplus]